MIAFLATTAWQVSTVIAGALLGIVCLRHESAATRHWIVLLGLLLASVVGPLSLLTPEQVRAPWRVTLSEPAGTAARTAGRQGTGTPAADAVRRGGRDVDATIAVVGVRSQAAAYRLPAGLLVSWGAGAAVALTLLLAGLVRLRWLATHARPLSDGVWRERAHAVANRYRIAAPVRVLQSGHSTLLATWGWRRPVVLLPAGAESWRRDRIEVVLAHELAHVARHDWATQLFASVLRALFWFNPLLWIATRRLRRESELACDDRVLALGIDGADYAGHLVDLARLLHADRERWLPAVTMTRPSHLQRRVRAMLSSSTNRRPISSATRILTGAALCAVTAMVAVAGAQSALYSLSGVVRDATERVMPNVQVVLTNPSNQSKFEVRSNASGRYEFVGLPPAIYALETLVAGFRPLKDEIAISAATVHDLKLHVSSLQETVSVRGSTSQSPESPQPPDPAAVQSARQRFETLRTQSLEMCATRTTELGGNIKPPRKLLDVRPVYPTQLRAAGVGGRVTMVATIGVDGLVRQIRDVKGPHPELAAAASDAVSQWQFSNTWLNCEAVEVDMQVTVNFAVTP